MKSEGHLSLQCDPVLMEGVGVGEGRREMERLINALGRRVKEALN